MRLQKLSVNGIESILYQVGVPYPVIPDLGQQFPGFVPGVVLGELIGHDFILEDYHSWLNWFGIKERLPFSCG